MRTAVPRVLRVALTLLGLLTITGRADASGFVYVAVPAAGCLPTPCATPVLVVVDASTMRTVIRIPLPAQTLPVGIAIAPNGAHLYVSNRAQSGGTTSLTVIDARRHVLDATHAVPAAGRLAVRFDDSRVFIQSRDTVPPQVDAFSTATHSIVGTIPIGVPGGIAAAASVDRLYVFEQTGVLPNCCGLSRVTLYDAGSLTELTHRDFGRDAMGLALSRDDLRLHVLLGGATTGFRLGLWGTLDAATLTGSTIQGPTEFRHDPVEVTSRNELLAAGCCEAIFRFDLGSSISSSIPLSGRRATALTVPPGDASVFATVVAQPSTASGQFEGLVAVNLATAVTTPVLPYRPFNDAFNYDTRAMTSTPAGAQACSYRLDRAYSSFPVNGGSGSIRLTTTCDWEASSSEPWAQISTTAGAGTTTITLNVDPHVLPTPRTATLTIAGQIVRVTQAGGHSNPPFGVIDTPADNASGIAGSLAVTGWALDDVGVSRVRVFRDPVAGEANTLIYLGDATFVEGTRPDVQAFMPSAPFASRAGWGLMVLTNMLPNGGNGTFRLWAIADDVEGHATVLGIRAFSASNAGATVPFGTIDTPGEGEVVSGTIVNFGWALTPQPEIIPTDGSTIDVVIDGVVVGHPVYDNFRGDIVGAVPGLSEFGWRRWVLLL